MEGLKIKHIYLGRIRCRYLGEMNVTIEIAIVCHSNFMRIWNSWDWHCHTASHTTKLTYTRYYVNSSWPATWTKDLCSDFHPFVTDNVNSLFLFRSGFLLHVYIYSWVHTLCRCRADAYARTRTLYLSNGWHNIVCCLCFLISTGIRLVANNLVAKKSSFCSFLIFPDSHIVSISFPSALGRIDSNEANLRCVHHRIYRSWFNGCDYRRLRCNAVPQSIYVTRKLEMFCVCVSVSMCVPAWNGCNSFCGEQSVQICDTVNCFYRLRCVFILCGGWDGRSVCVVILAYADVVECIVTRCGNQSTLDDRCLPVAVCTIHEIIFGSVLRSQYG